MIDLISTIIIGLFAGLVIAAIMALKYWTELSKIKNDNAKYVVLRDLEGHMRKIGKFHSFGMADDKFTIKIHKDTPEGAVIEEWVIDLGIKYHFEGISKDYGTELMILTNFHASNLERRWIKPLVDIDILEIGLTQGLRAINDKLNPLYTQIDMLREQNTELLNELQQAVIESDQARLEHIKEMKLKYKPLLDAVLNEYMSAPDYVRAKIDEVKGTYQKQVPDLPKKPQPATRQSPEKATKKPQPISKTSPKALVKIASESAEIGSDSD